MSYSIKVDRQFRTKRVIVRKMQSGKEKRLEMKKTTSGWTVNNRKRKDLRDCVDVDLSASPVTNTLPIRRRRMKIGEKVEFTMAWVKLPSLIVRPIRQSYKRLGRRTYRYRSSSGFTARLEVDNFGLVIRYGNIWKQIN